MKGISTIIAAIMLTVITIGLVATAYLYFSSIVQVGPVVELAAAYCKKTDGTFNITLVIRNSGTSDLNTGNLTFVVDANDYSTSTTCDVDTLSSGESTTCEISRTGGFSSGLHQVLVVGPRNQAGGPLTC